MRKSNKGTNNTVIFLVVLAMIFQIVAPVMENYSYANEKTVSGDVYGGNLELFQNQFSLGEPKDLGNIFTDVTLKVDKNGDGNFVEIQTDSNTRIEISDNTEVRLEYKWEIGDNVNLQDGDYATIQIPDAFEGLTGALKGELRGEVNGTPDTLVGTFTIDNNQLEVVFNGELVGLSNRSGDVWAYLKFNETKLNDDANQIIKFEENINKTFEVTAIPGGTASVISKSGVPNKTKNADYVNWVIDVNTKLEELTSGIVEDTIPEGLGKAYDIEVYDLIVGADGSIKDNSTLTNPQPSNEETTDGFKVNLGQTSQAYRIRYNTKILDHSKTEYNNIATLKDGETEKDTGKFDIGTLEIGSTIEKTGAPNNGGTNSDKITWTIDVNKAQLALDNVTVVDEFTEKSGHELNIIEIRIFKIDEYGNKQGGNIANNYGNPTTFPVSLNNLENQAIRIEYDTYIVYNEYKHTDNIFKNKVTLNVDGTQKGDPVVATVTVGRETLIEKDGVEGTYYGQPFIDWTLHINKAKHNIKDATVTDNIGDGLKLVEDTIKIYQGNTSNEYDSGNIIEKSANSFKVELGNISDYYTIKYRTNIIDPSKSLKNEAELYGNGLKGDGIGIGPDLGIIKTGEIGPRNTVSNSYTKKTVDNKTVDGITYDGLNHTDKTMSWKITVNAIKEEVTELTITDTFAPANSMVFLSDSLKVKKGSDILTKGTDYTLTDNKVGGFELKFIGSHEPLKRAQYDIYYKTSFDPDIVLAEGGTLNIGKNYANTAIFTGKVKDVAGVETDISPSDSDNYNIDEVVSKGGKKDGVLDRSNRKINWKVYSNPLAQDLTGEEFKITDTIGESIASSTDGKSGQKFDENSIVVKTYSLNKDGTIQPGNEITTGFNITYKKPDGTTTEDTSEAGKFEISFKEGVDVPVMVEYTTNIEGISKDKYNNSANITGKYNLNKTFPKYVTYDNHNAFISKEASSVNNNQVYTDDEIKWELKINESLSEINAGSVLTDEMSDGLVYLNGSLDIKKPNGNSLVEGTDYTFTIENNKLTITFIKQVTEVYTVTYKTAVTAGKGVPISNNASFNGESGTVTGSGEKNYTVRQFSGGSGTGVTRGSIKIVKIDAEDNTRKLQDAEFEIYYMLNGTLKQIIKDSNGNNTHKTNATGEIELKGLVLGREYHIREVTAPSGYVLDSSDGVVRTLTSIAGEKDIELLFTNTKVTSAKGNIRFTKIDKDEDVLKGAEFKLYKKSAPNTAIDTATSDKDGLVEFKDVLVGDYIIKETEAPTGYVLNTNLIEVEVEVTTNGETIELDDVVNERIIGNIKFTKYSKHLNNKETLSGAEFKLYKKPYTDGDESIQTVTSGSNGLVEFSNIPYGEYVIIENKAPDGYLKSTKEIEVQIKENGKTVELSKDAEEKLFNTRIDADIQVKKFGEGNNPPALEGAEFELLQGGNVKYTSTTAQDGTEIFKNVEYGEYTLKESKAPEGYNLSDKTYKVIVNEHRDETLVFEYINTKIRGNIEFIKADEEDQGLPDAEFTIYKKSDTKFANPIDTTISDENGLVKFEDVEYGKYIIKETKEPEGYNLSSELIEVEIKENKATVYPLKEGLSNTRIRGSLEITKVRKNTDRPLKNAKIALYTEKGQLVDEKVTGEDGKVTFENLVYGKYYFIETKAPYGYVRSRDKHPIEIKENDVTVKFKFDNKLIPSEPVDPIEPWEPWEPTEPKEPKEPKEPEEPTDPEEPVDPEEPTDPEDPQDPEEPTDPIEETTEPDTPVEVEIDIPEGGIVVEPPKNGKVEIIDGKPIYTPDPGFVGKDKFVIRTPDGDIVVEIDVETPLGSKEVESLPKTGEIDEKIFYAIGLLLVLAGIFIRKKLV